MCLDLELTAIHLYTHAACERKKKKKKKKTASRNRAAGFSSCPQKIRLDVRTARGKSKNPDPTFKTLGRAKK